MVSFFIIKFLWGVALRVFFCCCLDHNLLGNKIKKIDEKIKKIKALKKKYNHQNFLFLWKSQASLGLSLRFPFLF